MHEIDTRGNFYTYYQGKEANEVVFVGDSLAATEAGREIAAPFMLSVDYGPADGPIILAGTERLNLYTDIYSDPNFPEDQYISGYYPIFNAAGDPVGAIGIDFRADYVRRVQQDVENAFLPVLGITAVLVLIMVFLVSQLLTRRIKALTHAAERIGEGNYDQDLTGLTPGRFADEIGTLAHVFQIMVSKVATRERKLKEQVAELQIIIDESRRQEQVDEIVDSDFFRDLQI
jgi:methyl-accepting chemotaxis protein